MNKFLSLTYVMMLTSMLSTAHAAFNWNRFYAGVNNSMVINTLQLNAQQLGFTEVNDSCNNSSVFASLSPGIQLGYMHTLPYDLVMGIETNFSWNTNQNEVINCDCDINANVSDRFIFKNTLQGSIKTRFGYPINFYQYLFLPYLTTGASFSNTQLTYKNEGADYDVTHPTSVGWLIGGGVEWPFLTNLSLAFEYFYADYGNAINLKIPVVYDLEDPNGHANLQYQSHNIVLALHYWLP